MLEFEFVSLFQHKEACYAHRFLFLQSWKGQILLTKQLLLHTQISMSPKSKP